MSYKAVHLRLIWMHFITHWDRVTHICVGKLTIIGSDNGLSPGRHQAIIWNNAGRLLIRPAGTNVSEVVIGNQTFSFKKMHLKMSSAKWRTFCLGLNVKHSEFYVRVTLPFTILHNLDRQWATFCKIIFKSPTTCFWAEKSYIHGNDKMLIQPMGIIVSLRETTDLGLTASASYFCDGNFRFT